MTRTLAAGLLWLAAAAVLACGERRAAPADAGATPPAPGRSWVTAAPPVEDDGPIARALPRMVHRGGPFIQNPHVVTVTFARDDPQMVARIHQFASTIPRTPWWREVVDSYCSAPDQCIGEGYSARQVVLDDVVPAEVRDVDVDALLLAAVRAGKLGPLGANVVAMVYLPPGVTLSDLRGRYCDHGPRAYHRLLDLGGGKQLAYAVMARCGSEAELTGTASHELLEATTNPVPDDRGFALESSPRALPFGLAGSEPVDPCGLITMDQHWAFESGFTVHRAWSNRAAAGGHDPCVPSRPGRPYLALIPSQPAVVLSKPGDHVTLQLQAHADQAVPRWAASAFDVTGLQENDHLVDAVVEPPMVAAGDTAKLTLTLVKPGRRPLIMVGVVSTLAARAYLWPLIVNTGGGG